MSMACMRRKPLQSGWATLGSRCSAPTFHSWIVACAGLQELKATSNMLSDARQQVEKLETEEGQAQAALLQTEISIVESRRRAQELQQQVVKLAEDMKVRALWCSSELSGHQQSMSAEGQVSRRLAGLVFSPKQH